MTEICKCRHKKEHHYGLDDLRDSCSYFKCKCKKFEPKKGCGKEFDIDYRKALVRCGTTGYLCANCKPKNHSQQKRQNTAITSGLDAGTYNLSEKIVHPRKLKVEDVKESIKLVKDIVLNGDLTRVETMVRINKIFGNKLT